MSNLSDTRSETMLGNQNRVSIKDPEARQRAYKAYCDWLEKGKTKKSFTYEEGDLMCVWQTIENWMKHDNYKSEFDPIKKEIAYAKGCSKWEGIVDETGEGKNTRASIPTLNMIMRNKFKWDTLEQINDPAEKTADLNRFVEAQETARGVYTPSTPLSRSSGPEKKAPSQEDSRTSQ